jgi:ABC-type Zn uptake system ZnuABC Zn-binding protein ZnuA
MQMLRIAFTGLVALAMAAGFVGTAFGLNVVATTTIVADVVRAVAGEDVDLVTLLPANADPHAFQPTPNDVVRLAEADVVFLSGADLEADLADILATAGGLIVDLSTRVALRDSASLEHHHESTGHDEDADDHEHGDDDEHGDEDHEHEDEEHDHGAYDPHVWFDPTNVMIWTSAIEGTLGELDPENASEYASRAASYQSALADLDLWIWGQIGRIPNERRNLVTDHLAFGYFAARYGLRQVGTIFPGTSTLSEPSAKELAELIDTIRELDVPAIFVGTTVSPALAETVAADTGTEIVVLYTGALSEPTGPAGTYIEFMRFNTEAIVGGLIR